MGGVETYAILGAKAFINKPDTTILIPRLQGFEEISNYNNVIVDKHYALNKFSGYIIWIINNFIKNKELTIITFNYYTPILNKKSISTIMDLRPLEQGIIKKLFFKLNVSYKVLRSNIYYAISPHVKQEFQIKFNRKIPYVPTYIENPKVKIKGDYNFKNYALIISSDLPHKNLELIYKIEDHLLMNIIIIGPTNKKDFKYNTRKIKHLGFVSESEKLELIIKSNFLIFPTTFEGFGYPVLEAAQFSKQIICNNLEVFNSLFGDFPIYVNSNTPELWIKQINQTHLTLINKKSDKKTSKKLNKNMAYYFDSFRFMKDLLNLQV